MPPSPRHRTALLRTLRCAGRCTRLALLLAIASPALLLAQAPASTIAGAAQLRAEGHLPEASAALETFLAAHPDDVPALVELARVRLAASDTAAARSLLDRALAVSPNSPAPNDLLGSLLLDTKHLPEAMDRFETTLAVAPQDSAARSGEFTAATALALQARAAGNPQAALLCLEHAAEYLHENVDLLTDIGLVSADLHLYRRADRALSRALGLDPGNTRALYAAGRVATEAQHLPEAERYLRAYLALKPADATAHFGLGHVLAMELNTAAATAEFQQSIALQPAQSESFYQLGVLASNAGDDAGAATLFRKTLSRNPRHGGALTGLGELAYRQRNYPAAETSLTAAVQAAPDYQPAHYYLGLTLARLGQSTASTRELNRATELTRQQQAKSAPEPGEAPTP